MMLIALQTDATRVVTHGYRLLSALWYGVKSQAYSLSY